MGLFDSFKQAASDAMNQAGSMLSGTQGQAYMQMSEDATRAWNAIYHDEMGLEMHEVDTQSLEKVKGGYSGGTHVVYTGTYQGVPLEWSQISYTAIKSGGTSIVDDKKLIFTIPSVGDWSVIVSQRVKGMQGGVLTGVESFDEHLHVSTNDEARFKEVFSTELLSEFGDRGWLNLTIQDDKLIVSDDFASKMYTAQVTGAMKAVTELHPYWGYSVTQPIPNVELSIRFVRALAQLAKRLGA